MTTSREGKASQAGSKLMKRRADAGAAKTRLLVTVGPNGNARVEPMPQRTPLHENKTPVKLHSRPKLTSKRGSPVHGAKSCYACAVFGQVRQYEALTVGKVLLCADCAGKARDETFGRPEPLDYARSSGGFETNRRRH